MPIIIPKNQPSNIVLKSKQVFVINSDRAEIFYRNWINYVYQVTPYQL